MQVTWRLVECSHSSRWMEPGELWTTSPRQLRRTMMCMTRSYDVYDKEFLAVIRALREWQAYLIGAEEMIEIWTDHANLQYFQKPQKLKPRQVHWVGELQCFDFEIKYHTRKSNNKADALSW